MSNYRIRLYRDSDYERVRDLYAQGVIEHTTTAFKQALHNPHIWTAFLFVFFVPLVVFGSILVSLLALVFLLVILRLCSREVFQAYVRDALAGDLKDIHRYYTQKDGYRLWVAEQGGQVIGIVAAVQSIYTKVEKHVELTRMSVAKSHRGKGIAKALCRTLIAYAQERKCELIILLTTSAQLDGHRLYESLGFKKKFWFDPPKFISRFIGLKLFIYQYDILTYM
ncbi:putative N-acetyltransferase CML1 isoform 1-T1 [Discoglossus pictus]